jgi:hypothetical protein
MARLRAVLAALCVAFCGFWCVTFYFSTEFWRQEANWMFGKDETDLVESISWGEPEVVEVHVGDFIGMRTDLQPKAFGAEHLSLPGPALYVFGRDLLPLRTFYKNLVAPGRMREFGQAFSIRSNLESGSWLAERGWTYKVTCDDRSRTAHLPVLFHLYYTFSNFFCHSDVAHIWRGRWRGPATDLRLWFGGTASVEISPGDTVASKPDDRWLDFKAQPEAIITIRITGPTSILAALYVVTPTLERVPYWEWVDPVALE